MRMSQTALQHLGSCTVLFLQLQRFTCLPASTISPWTWLVDFENKNLISVLRLSFQFVLQGTEKVSSNIGKSDIVHHCFIVPYRSLYLVCSAGHFTSHISE